MTFANIDTDSRAGFIAFAKKELIVFWAIITLTDFNLEKSA